ncbi:MAG: chemoreceptor glutamine deamidase CheD [Proteobacteria bacterium]|nr:chemoreceptor glutamine deamidase CheD [Pseudomonadota bacterium]
MLNSRAATKPERPRPVAGFEDIACAWDVALGHWCAKILPGEFYITRTDEAITTVLGSCISACIRDPGVGGMNHFMLPEDTTQGKSTWLDEDAGLATRYGSFAMESLVNGLLKLGARRERLEVKLFGGGHILNVGIDVGDRNIEFARRFLKTEGFSVVAEDVGLNVPRRVVYFPTTGKVRVKHLRTLDTREIAQREQQYLRKTVDKPATGEIELF